MKLHLIVFFTSLATFISLVSAAKEKENFSPEEAIIDVVQKYDISIDLSLKLIFRGDVLFSPLGQLGGHAFSMQSKPGLLSTRLTSQDPLDRVGSSSGIRLYQ